MRDYTRRVGRFAVPILTLAAALSLNAAALKYEHGQLLRLDPRDESVWAGNTHIEVARRASQFRRITIRDFSLSSSGTLAVSASASMNVGVMTNVVLLFKLNDPAPPTALATGDVFCEHLAWNQTNLLCMGPDFRKMVAGEPHAVLWLLTPDGDLKPLLRRDQFPAGVAPPWKTAALGDPQLLVSDSVSWIWNPSAGSVVKVPPDSSQLVNFNVSIAERGRSRISMAAWNETVVALLPIRRRAEEGFTTPYALFALDTRTGGWLTASQSLLPRGAQLLAVENGQAVIWDRRGKGTLLRIPLDISSR
jgi:hypothetical protein